MFAWVILLLLCGWHSLRSFAVASRFLINPQTLPRKDILLLLASLLTQAGLPFEVLRLYVVERRGEIDINVGIYDANGLVLVFWLDLENVDFKLLSENLDSDGIFFVETGEVPELVLKDGFGVVEFDELGLMRLQLDHVSDVTVFPFHVGHHSHGCWGSWLRELKHPEHPVWNVAQSLLRHELQNPAVCHLWPVFQTKNQRVFVLAVQQRVQLIQCRRRQQYFISLFDVLSKGERCGVYTKPF